MPNHSSSDDSRYLQRLEHLESALGRQQDAIQDTLQRFREEIGLGVRTVKAQIEALELRINELPIPDPEAIENPIIDQLNRTTSRQRDIEHKMLTLEETIQSFRSQYLDH